MAFIITRSYACITYFSHLTMLLPSLVSIPLQLALVFSNNLLYLCLTDTLTYTHIYKPLSHRYTHIHSHTLNTQTYIQKDTHTHIYTLTHRDTLVHTHTHLRNLDSAMLLFRRNSLPLFIPQRRIKESCFRQDH